LYVESISSKRDCKDLRILKAGFPDKMITKFDRKISKLKTFFSLLPFSISGSLIVRSKIINSSGNLFHPRSFNIYNNYCNGLSINETIKKVKLPKKFNLFNVDYDTDLSEMNKYLPVNLSKVSRIVSYNPPDYSHSQKIKQIPSLFLAFFYESKNIERKIRHRINEQIIDKDYSIIPGSYKYTQQLMDVLSEPAPIKRFCYNDMVEGIRMFAHLLPTNDGKLALPGSWRCGSIKVNRDSYSGYISSKVLGKLKGDVISKSGFIAMEYFEFIINRKGFCFDVFAWSLGGREKRASSSKVGEVTSRDTWMIEDVLNRVISPLGENFMDMLREQDSHCPLFLGKTITQGKSLDYIRTYVHGEVEFADSEFTEGGWIIPIDYSKFSLRIYEELIVCAMSIFSSYFDMKDKRVQKIMMFITNSVVNKNLVLPESGLTYQFTKGIPSGHSLTSILNTIVNFIVVATSLSKAGLTLREQKSVRFICAGDDTLIFVPLSVSLQALDRCFIRSGMKMDLPSEVAVLNNCQHKDYMPVFLKRSFLDFHAPAVWNEASLFENLISPNKTRDFLSLEGLHEEKERVYGLYKHAPFNDEHNKLLFQYIRYIEGLIRCFVLGDGYNLYSDEFIAEVNNLVKRRNRAKSYKSQFFYPGYISSENFADEEFSRKVIYSFIQKETKTKNLQSDCSVYLYELLGCGSELNLTGFFFKKPNYLKIPLRPP
jgi:hypothetical protein